MGVPVLKMAASPRVWACRRRCQYRADIDPVPCSVANMVLVPMAVVWLVFALSLPWLSKRSFVDDGDGSSHAMADEPRGGSG